MTLYNNPTRNSLFHIFVTAASSRGVYIGDPKLSLFVKYEEELLRWNDKINLVSLKKQEDLWTKHFLDSLSAAQFIGKKAGRLLDIGTGGGFPGLPLGIVLPQLRVYLLEASRKKSSFLKQVIRLLGLNNATVINERAEKAQTDPQFQYSFDTVISRAAFKLPDIVRYAAGFLVADGIVIAMKGGHVLGQELAEAKSVAALVGLSFLSCEELKKSTDQERRIIVIFKKTSNHLSYQDTGAP